MNSNSCVTDTKYLAEKNKNLCANKRPFSIELSNLKSSSESGSSFLDPKRLRVLRAQLDLIKIPLHRFSQPTIAPLLLLLMGLLYR